MKNREDKLYCMWCGWYINTDLENHKGYCYLDIGEYIDNTKMDCCSDYCYDEDLDRC